MICQLDKFMSLIVLWGFQIINFVIKTKTMPQRCAVPLCNEKTGGHKFPTGKAILKKWLVAIRRVNHIPSRHCRICKKHFTDDDYEFPWAAVEEHARPRLKKDAVPSRFPWNDVSFNTLKKIKNTVDRIKERDIIRSKIQTIKKKNADEYLDSLPELPYDLLDTDDLPEMNLDEPLIEFDDIDEFI